MARPPVAVSADTYRGHLGTRNLAFLRNLLAQTPGDDLIVLATHIPLHTDTAPDDPRNVTIDRAALLDLLRGRTVLSLAGHTHTTEHHCLAEGHHHHVLTAVSGSWWSGPDTRTGIPSADSRDGTPNGFHVLAIRGRDYTTRFVSAQGAPDETMRIAFESELRPGAPETVRATRPMQGLRPPVPQAALSATDLVVNVFDGGPRTSLAYRIGGAAPVAMARTRRPDPFVTESLRALSGGQEELGQGGAVEPRPGRAPARRPRPRRPPRQRGGAGRIRPADPIVRGARGHRGGRAGLSLHARCGMRAAPELHRRAAR